MALEEGTGRPSIVIVISRLLVGGMGRSDKLSGETNGEGSR